MGSIVVILKGREIPVYDPVMALEAPAVEAASFSSLTGHALMSAATSDATLSSTSLIDCLPFSIFHNTADFQ
jgi:hypothetical protein